MVKKLMTIGVSGTVLLLSSCSVLSLFLISVFPVTATQTVARLDLSIDIPPENAKSFRLTELLSGGSRFYVLVSDQSSDGTCIFVMNESLELVQSWSYNELRNICGDFNGNCAMVDDFGSIVIGNLRFSYDPDTEKLTALYPPTSPVPTPLRSEGFSLSGESENIANIRIDEGNSELEYEVFGSDWFQDGGATYPVFKEAKIGNDGPYELTAVFVDPAESGKVTIVMRLKSDDENEAYRIVQIPKSHFSSTGMVSVNILDEYPNCRVDEAASELFGYSEDGLVMYQYRESNFVLFDIDPLVNSIISHETLHYYKAPTDVKTVYAMDGDFSYTFDRARRIVTKLVTWW